MAVWDYIGKLYVDGSCFRTTNPVLCHGNDMYVRMSDEAWNLHEGWLFIKIWLWDKVLSLSFLSISIQQINSAAGRGLISWRIEINSALYVSVCWCWCFSYLNCHEISEIKYTGMLTIWILIMCIMLSQGCLQGECNDFRNVWGMKVEGHTIWNENLLRGSTLWSYHGVNGHQLSERFIR